jgi:hypothetical protein
MMAHWLLRRRMAEHDDGHARIQDEQRQPEQNESKDQVRGREDRFDREAPDGANRVRPRESSAK